VLGGNEAFWKAHDLLFESGRKLADFDYRGLAAQLDLDPDQFLETMDSAAVMDRIKEDIKLGIQVGVDATPAVYLSGRRVPRVAVRVPIFWQSAKQKLDRILRGMEARKQAQEQQDLMGPPAPPSSPSSEAGRQEQPGNK
jgi:protein-disulfide isomerase